MWVLTAGQYAASITAILALFGIVVKWGIVKPIKNYIDIAKEWKFGRWQIGCKSH